tara:strand:- start:1757 stop:2896 length:1140 start_codon:yes stop_codon:yes gene_type:complete
MMMENQPLTANALIDQLAARHPIDMDRAREVVDTRLQHNPLPIYMRVLLGMGAGLGSAFLIGFIFVASCGSAPWFMYGVVFVLAAIGLHLGVRRLKQDSAAASFLTQLSFTFIVTGKILVVFGAVEAGMFTRNDELTVFLCMLLLTLGTYFVYDLYIDRLVSSVATLASGLFYLFGGLHGLDELQLAISFSIITPIALTMMAHPWVSRTYRPVSVAMVVVAIGLGTVVASEGGRFNAGDGFILEIDLAMLLSSISMMVALVGTIAWASGGRSALAKRPVQVGIVTAVVMGLALMASPMLAIALVVLGHAQHDRLVALAGTLYLPFSLFLYARRLDLGLMNTGLLLLGQGLVLVAVYFIYKKWAFVDEAVPLPESPYRME